MDFSFYPAGCTENASIEPAGYPGLPVVPESRDFYHIHETHVSYHVCYNTCVTSHVLHRMCYITCVTSHVLHHMCYITCVTSHENITYVTSQVLHHMCYFTCNTCVISLHHMCYITCNSCVTSYHYTCYIECVTIHVLHHMCYDICVTPHVQTQTQTALHIWKECYKLIVIVENTCIC